MQLTAVSTFNARKSADILILPFWQDKNKAVSAHAGHDLDAFATPPIESGDFLGKEGETQIVYLSKHKEKRLLLLGLGEESKADVESLRRAFAAAVRVVLKKKCNALNVALPHTKQLHAPLVVRGICEGLLLTNYSFTALKHDALKAQPAHAFDHVCLIGAHPKELELAKKTVKIVAAVDFVRDLVNGNADDVTPQMLSHTAKELAKQFPSIKATIFDKKKIEAEKMGLLLAVSQGAARDPAFIILQYNGNPSSKEQTALVGKGITYDTGGLNLKPTGGIETMKCDMAGAAAVLGTLRAAAALKLKCNLIGVIATTENAIGPGSYKPGDVYKSHSGKMVEISNTDAEGRLVLADAFSYLQKEYNPKRIIDLATLTGGVVIALGEEISGLFSNDDQLAKSLGEAGIKSGEFVWRLPIYPAYKEALKSMVADIKNASSSRNASAITAAVFLSEFIGKVSWAHLDIAGTAFHSTPKHYNQSNATGVGVRLLVEFLESL
jgi:leucyl aminopeptidase